MEKVYVVGHLNPDTDTVISAIAVAKYLNAVSESDTYVAAMTGNVNSETDFVFKKFNIQKPMLLEDASGKLLFLVDHNEKTQMVKGADVEKVLGFIDHHKVKFENSKPITITVLPWGSTSSIAYNLLSEVGNVQIEDSLKAGLLCGMLSDTVILKSPTTTDQDRVYVKKLAEELSIDYKELGMEMFKAKAQISSKSAQQIITNDFKNFDFNGKKVGIGQLEAPDLAEVEAKIPEILGKMEEMKNSESYHSLILMLTDIIQEGTKLLVVSDDEERIAELYKTIINNKLSDFIPGMMSRKKQVMPVLAENL
jgi:manganese-dependent inorganic pyrophosphatase